jgi:hypothetical protein
MHATGAAAAAVACGRAAGGGGRLGARRPLQMRLRHSFTVPTSMRLQADQMVVVSA